MKKAFTLIELLGVILILGVILAIAFITTTNIIKNSKMNAYNEIINNIKNTAEMYISNGNVGYIEEGETLELTLNELVTEGYLKEVESPFNKNKTCNGYLLVTKISGDYSYVPHVNCEENMRSSSEDGLLASYNFDEKSEYRKNLILNPTINALPRLSASAQSISYGTAIRSTDQAFVGTHSLKFYYDYSTMSGNISLASNDLSGMVAGQTYTFSVYVYVPSSVDLSSIRLLFYDYVTSASNTNVYFYDADIPRDTWHRLSVTRTLRTTANRAYATIAWYHNEPLNSIGQSIYFDAFQIEQGSVPTEYAADADNLVLNSACNATPRLSSTTLTTSWVTASCSSNRAYVGTKSLKMTRTIAYNYIRYNFNSSNLSGMVPGRDNTLSFYIYVPEDNTAFTSIRIYWYEYAPSGNINTSKYHYIADIPKGQWHRVSMTKKLKSDLTSSYIRLYSYHTASASSHNQPVYIDGLQLEVSSAPTEFISTYENGLVKDYSINNNDISLIANSPYWVSSDDERERFYEFKNSAIISTTNNIGISGSQPRTIMGWINTRDGQTGTSNFSVMAGHGTSETGNDFMLGVQSNKIAVGYWGTYTVGNKTIDNNKWYHIAATYDGSKTRIYINGELDKEESKVLNTPSGLLMLGNRYNGAHSFDGYIDDVKIYNRTLSNDEIKFYYNITK